MVQVPVLFGSEHCPTSGASLRHRLRCHHGLMPGLQKHVLLPEVFTEPWTIRMPLYRRVEDNLQLVEYKCVEFTEELIWGHLKKQDQ